MVCIIFFLLFKPSEQSGFKLLGLETISCLASTEVSRISDRFSLALISTLRSVTEGPNLERY
jgi:hypothetical protein